ncbi:MAG: ATP-grasp domain-containing protein [Myxococcota bacterium]
MAVLPRGIDGLFMRRAPSAAGFRYLVEAGSPDEAWARAFLPASALLRYRLRGALGPSPTTPEILAASDVGLVMARAGIAHLLLTLSRTQAMQAWARLQRVTLLAPAPAHRVLEDKLWFHRFMRREGIPQPAGGAVDIARARRLDWRRRQVLQDPGSCGGEGTWFPEGPADIDALVAAGALLPGARYLARRFIDGRPYGITVLVAPGRVALSALRLQCYFPARDGVREFAGLQWTPTAAFAPATLARIEQVMLRLGRALHRRRFLGFANIDFMLDGDGQVFVLECNPRMSASSPHVFRHPELLGGASAGAAAGAEAGFDPAELLLAGFARRQAWPARAVAHGISASTFEGATLDVLAGQLASAVCPERTRAAPGSGVVTLPLERPWRASRPDPDPLTLGPGRAFVYFPRPAGVELAPETVLANIIADARLFDDEGDLLAAGRALFDRLGAETCH